MALTDQELQMLLRVAEQAVVTAVLEGTVVHPDVADHPPALGEPGAAFVTLRRHGRLRGCIGTLTADRPLVVAVAEKAAAAALDDPRFAPVTAAELDDVEVSVSVLGPPEPLAVDGLTELARALRPGVDGVVVEAGPHRATFLPAVWADMPDPTDFLEALWHKAGLARRAWPRDIRISRYTAQHVPPDPPTAGHVRLTR